MRLGLSMNPKSSSLSFVAMLASASLLVACSSPKPPAPPSQEPVRSGPTAPRSPYVIADTIREFDRRSAECAKLNGYLDERTARDGTANQVRRTILRGNDGYDCFGEGERELSPLSERRHSPPPIVPQSTRRTK